MKEATDEIVRDVTFVYIDGTSEWFEAIHLTKSCIILKRVINGIRVTYGFIPKGNIKEIMNEKRRI